MMTLMIVADQEVTVYDGQSMALGSRMTLTYCSDGESIEIRYQPGFAGDFPSIGEDVVHCVGIAENRRRPRNLMEALDIVGMDNGWREIILNDRKIWSAN